MKIKSLLLGIALVALMASCGKKTTETTTETVEDTSVETVAEEPVEETPAEEVVATPAAPATSAAKTNKTTAKAATNTKAAVDPCEAKVKAFEKWVDELKAAKKSKSEGAAALKAYVDLKAKAATMEASIKDCTSNADYKTRLQNAILAEKQAR